MNNNTTSPFGSYTTLAYMSVNRLLLHIVSICAGVISSATELLEWSFVRLKDAKKNLLRCVESMIKFMGGIYYDGICCWRNK